MICALQRFGPGHFRFERSKNLHIYRPFTSSRRTLSITGRLYYSRRTQWFTETSGLEQCLYQFLCSVTYRKRHYSGPTKVRLLIVFVFIVIAVHVFNHPALDPVTVDYSYGRIRVVT